GTSFDEGHAPACPGRLAENGAWQEWRNEAGQAAAGDSYRRHSSLYRERYGSGGMHGLRQPMHDGGPLPLDRDNARGPGAAFTAPGPFYLGRHPAVRHYVGRRSGRRTPIARPEAEASDLIATHRDGMLT